MTVTAGLLYPRDAVFEAAARRELVWIPERGMGYYPVSAPPPYDAAYFDKYVGYAATTMGQGITDARVELVNRYTLGEVVDVGVGCGTFIMARGALTYGFDINPAGRHWLIDRDLWKDPTSVPVQAASFWDALEHIQDPAPILDNVGQWVFVSLPLFTGPDHVLSSKHFRRDEHYWYWTREGLIWWMGEHGFECVEHATPESLLGREDIHTFVFRRATAGTEQPQEPGQPVERS